MWSIQDPKDPWAWRNTWTGEIRNSYDDLWIVIPIIVLVTVFAMLFLIPILIHRYCPHCFPGRVWCRWFESLLFVLGQISREKEEKRIERKRPTRAHPRAHSAPNFHDHVEYGVPHSIPIKTESPPQYQSLSSVRPSLYQEPFEVIKRYSQRRPRKRARSENRRGKSRRRIDKHHSIPPLHFK